MPSCSARLQWPLLNSQPSIITLFTFVFSIPTIPDAHNKYMCGGQKLAYSTQFILSVFCSLKKGVRFSSLHTIYFQNSTTKSFNWGKKKSQFGKLWSHSLDLVCLLSINKSRKLFCRIVSFQMLLIHDPLSIIYFIFLQFPTTEMTDNGTVHPKVHPCLDPCVTGPPVVRPQFPGGVSPAPVLSMHCALSFDWLDCQSVLRHLLNSVPRVFLFWFSRARD